MKHKGWQEAERCGGNGNTKRMMPGFKGWIFSRNGFSPEHLTLEGGDCEGGPSNETGSHVSLVRAGRIWPLPQVPGHDLPTDPRGHPGPSGTALGTAGSSPGKWAPPWWRDVTVWKLRIQQDTVTVGREGLPCDGWVYGPPLVSDKDTRSGQWCQASTMPCSLTDEAEHSCIPSYLRSISHQCRSHSRKM